MRRKALLAIAFAGGLLNPQLPALSKNESNSTDSVSKNTSTDSVSKDTSPDSVIQRIANNTNLTSASRAYNLLLIAQLYLNGHSDTYVNSQFEHTASATTSARFFTNKYWPDNLASFTHQVVRDSSAKERTTSRLQTDSDLPAKQNENLVSANIAIQKAVTQLESVTDPLSKLNMYFIASRLFHRMGNIHEARKYNKALENAFYSYQLPVHEEQINAAYSVLDAMAYGVIAVNLPRNAEQESPREEKTFTAKDFKASQKFKLRAIAMVDKLPATNHLRRKAHRDLVLWYQQLGKDELAAKEKEVLFELVGVKSEKILYPQSIGCGSVVWWELEPKMLAMLCGAG